MNFRYKLMQFMSGRYGVDKLFYGIFGLSMVLSLINIFVRSYFLQIIIYGIVIYAIFRMFSKNHPARRAENAWFTNILNVVRRKTDFQKQKKADKCHVYKKCPKCKAILRLPRRVGKHNTICPKCNTEFTVNVRK